MRQLLPTAAPAVCADSKSSLSDDELPRRASAEDLGRHAAGEDLLNLGAAGTGAKVSVILNDDQLLLVRT